jgi:tyrosine-protein phosphatase YwqE
LVSLPALCTPVETEEVRQQLDERGFSLIVAAPEGSPALRRNPQRLEKWLDGGAQLQLNAASITGAHGREAQRFALHCVKEYPNRVVIASKMSAGVARHTSLAQAREILARHFGKRRVQALFHETPAAILETAHEKDAAGMELDGRDRSGLLSQLFKLGKAATGAS